VNVYVQDTASSRFAGFYKIHDPLSPEEAERCTNARDTYLSTDDYWAVHTIAGFFEYNLLQDPSSPSFDPQSLVDWTLGWAPRCSLPDTVFVYSYAVTVRVEQWNEKWSRPDGSYDYLKVERDDVLAWTLSHELGHIFLGEGHAYNSLMANINVLPNQNNPKFRTFLKEQIKNIQKCPHPTYILPNSDE
jgi:hypothetical protein